jgi:hypothetical protein
MRSAVRGGTVRVNTLATEARDVLDRLPYYSDARNVDRRGWMSGGFGQHRDSDALERSNFETARRIYTDAGVQTAADAFNHWAVGWVEELVVPITTASVRILEELRARIDSYPVLDDEDFSEREWQENHPGDGHCYSEDYTEGDPCPCGLPHV